MHLHLDVVGGIAGDMFAATVLDAWPELESDLKAALDRAGFGRLVTVARNDFDDGVLVGSQVSVVPATDEAHHHRTWREIRGMLRDASLDSGVREHALAIFTLLAEAESTVHGKDIEEVAFHEVGAWDSIARRCHGGLVDQSPRRCNMVLFIGPRRSRHGEHRPWPATRADARHGASHSRHARAQRPSVWRSHYADRRRHTASHQSRFRRPLQ